MCDPQTSNSFFEYGFCQVPPPPRDLSAWSRPQRDSRVIAWCCRRASRISPGPLRQGRRVGAELLHRAAGDRLAVAEDGVLEVVRGQLCDAAVELGQVDG